VKILINKGARVNDASFENWTALILASQHGHVSCVDILLSKGANIDARTKIGGTALMKASEGGHTACVELLVARGADIDFVDNKGFTALFYAMTGGHDGCVAILNAKANASKRSRWRQFFLFVLVALLCIIYGKVFSFRILYTIVVSLIYLHSASFSFGSSVSPKSAAGERVPGGDRVKVASKAAESDDPITALFSKMTRKQLLAEIEQRGLTSKASGLSKMTELRTLLVDHEREKIKKKTKTEASSGKKKSASGSEQKYSKFTKKQLSDAIRSRGLEPVREASGFTKMKDLRRLLEDSDRRDVKGRSKSDPIHESTHNGDADDGSDREQGDDGEDTVYVEL
jgi:hypothetical protein